MKKRILSLFCVLALCLGLLPVGASAAGGEMTQYTHYLALGDRTCAACTNYASYTNCVYPYPARIACEKGYILTTSANKGETSGSLLNRLAEEETQIEKSAVVSVTIGNTDLLYALRDYLTETYNKAHPDSPLTADQVLDKMGKVDLTFLEVMKDPSVGSGFVNSEIFKATAAELEENLTEILETIQGYNPDAYLMVFNLYNPYYTLAWGSTASNEVAPYKDGIPAAYDNGATALNEIIAQVCGSGIHVVDAYAACMYIVNDPADSKSDFALRSNLKMRDKGDPSRLYSGVEAFYPHVNAAGVIGTKANELEDLPKSKGWPVESDYENHPPADWPGIIMASTSHGWWDIDGNNDMGTLYNMWGASMNDSQGAIAVWKNTLNLMGEWLAPGNKSDGYDGPFLNQDRCWKTTESDGKKALDFDSGSETYFEDYNVWLDEENATLHLKDAQLETNTTCLATNADVSDIFTGTDTLTIQLTGSSSFLSDGSYETITTDGYEGDLRFTGTGSLDVTIASPNTIKINSAIQVPNGNLSIADGARVTAHAVPTGAQATVIQAQNVTIEDGGTLAIDLAAGSNAQPFDTGADGTVTVEDGGALEVTVGSNLQADLTMLSAGSDLSRSTFRVDGLLVLPDDLTTESLPNIFSGSGLVELNGTFYAIAADGSLTTPDGENVVNGDIAVTLGTPVTDQEGYTWEQDEDGNWTLTLTASTVLGNISITQDTTGGKYYDPNESEYWEMEPDKTYANPDIVVQLVAEKPCAVYGQIRCAHAGPYDNTVYQFLLGTLEISGAGLSADAVSYRCGAIQLSGALNARSISAWRTRLLEDADLTLSEGISLTVNNMLTGILYDVRDNEDILNAYTDETVKDLVMERIGGTFVMENGARYSCTGTAGTPIQVELYFSILAGISTEKYTAPEYESQRFQVNLTQEDLENVIQIPYDLPSTASLVFSYENENLDDELYSIATGCFTLQSEGALELPVIYKISANPAEKDFGTVTEGYAAPAEQTVTITNTGNQPVTLTQPTADDYTIGTLSKETLNPADTATFTVRPDTGLAAGTYDKTLSIYGDEVQADVELRFTVTKKSGGSDSDDDSDSSSGSSSGNRSHGISVSYPINGTVTLSNNAYVSGATATITAIPDEGYQLDNLIVTDSKGNEIVLTEKGDGRYTFVMPASAVTVKALFVKIDAESESMPFTDVTETDWYADAVRYVYEHGLMAGTSVTTFSPDVTTSRSMIATILWRMAGSPVVNYDMDFSDVAQDQWYSEAIHWAASEGIVSGYGNGMFGTNDPITREQFAVMLYRFAQSKGYDTTQGGMTVREYGDFEQISDYAVEAMAWAVNTGLISGTSTTTLSPQDQATRAQAAAILKRFEENRMQ